MSLLPTTAMPAGEVQLITVLITSLVLFPISEKLATDTLYYY